MCASMALCAWHRKTAGVRATCLAIAMLQRWNAMCTLRVGQMDARALKGVSLSGGWTPPQSRRIGRCARAWLRYAHLPLHVRCVQCAHVRRTAHCGPHTRPADVLSICPREAEAECALRPTRTPANCWRSDRHLRNPSATSARTSRSFACAHLQSGRSAARAAPAAAAAARRPTSPAQHGQTGEA